MNPTYYAMLSAGKLAEISADVVSDEDLKAINGLKRNGPLRKLTADDIYVRAMYCVGESATTKLSIHPEGELNGKTLSTLSTIAKLLPGAPMMEGHRRDKIPWARIFKASVENVDNEGVVKAYYYFLRGIPEYDKIAKEIDAGIRGEGSISYWFTETKCSICHMKLDRYGWASFTGEKGFCAHELGKKYEGQVCYWYPDKIKGVAELSHVFRGAWEKTKGALYSPEIEQYFNTSELEGAKALDELLQDRLDGKPEKKGICPSCEHAFIFPEVESFKCPECETLLKIVDGKIEDLGRGDGKGKGGKKQGDGGSDKCVCPSCGHEAKHEKGIPCADVKCSKCGAKMEGKNGKVKNCLSCSAELSDDQAFCSACGKSTVPESLVGSPVGLVFPEKTETISNEHFSIDAFEKLEGDFLVEPAYDGVSIEAHRKGDVVSLFNNAGLDITDKFPGIVAELSKNLGDFIITGEIVKMRGHQRLERKDVLSHIDAKVLPEDKAFRLKASDVLYRTDSDLRDIPLIDRKAKLSETINSSDIIHLVKFEKVEGGSKLVSKIDELASREGCTVRTVNSAYADVVSLYSWKRLKELNVLVSKKTEADAKFMYNCTVSGKLIGTTYATDISAKDGDKLRVSVESVKHDKDTGEYFCTALNVVSVLCEDDKLDSASTLDNLSALKVEDESGSNSITLNDIIPGLIAAQRDYKVYLCGDIVENAETTKNVDLVVLNSLSVEDHDALVALFSEQYRERLTINVNPEPPKPFLELFSKAPEIKDVPEKNGSFVLQKHWWNKKPHWDFRLKAPDATELVGFTCFKEPSGSAKIMCQEKKAHELKWIDVNGRINTGEPGNPTKTLDAYMISKASGTCEIIRQESNFLEVVLSGDKLSGRYVFRELDIKRPMKHFIDNNKIHDDEVDTKTDKLWVMWKPVNQETKSTLMDIGYKYEAGCLMLWETEEEWRLNDD